MGVDLPLCSEEVDAILQVVFKNEKLQDPKVTFQSGSKIGEGYLGINSAVEIRDRNNILHLFIKAAPKHEKLREKMQVRLAFKNEFTFYTTILPTLKEFYWEKTGKSLEIVPKFYAGSDEELKEILVLENLKVQGFASNDSKNMFTKEQILLMMREYGKFHALSFALKDQQEETFNNLSKDLSDFFYLIFHSTGVIQILKTKCAVMEKYLQSPNDAVLLDKIRHLSENIEKYILKFKEFDGDHRVILHSDTNYNNLMFRNKENSLELRLVDFQGIRLNSPVLDLSYFLYASGCSEENLSQLDFFLDAYYESLSITIKELGSNPEQLCPLSVIKEHWKTFSVFGLMMALLLVGAFVDDSDEIVDIVEFANNSENNASRRPIPNEEHYAKIVKRIIKHFVENDFM